MADASCQEEVWGYLEQPEEVLLVRGKESLQQQIQTLHEDECREARKQRMAEQIRLVERKTLFCLTCGRDNGTSSKPGSCALDREALRSGVPRRDNRENWFEDKTKWPRRLGATVETRNPPGGRMKRKLAVVRGEACSDGFHSLHEQKNCKSSEGVCPAWTKVKGHPDWIKSGGLEVLRSNGSVWLYERLVA
ncbi:hypothetical protein EOD39_2933 [Acipenser ruthenus]|uniref:Uncharacterized protein n=1 Tax=Acipenser ruthenus TaxID=7906 RepID=A0A444TXF5_ACIRT|nr:hypothetical protein EOD39_2933 [Acipenser ruthenus]